MTTIKDTLYNANGKPVTRATINIESPRFTTADGRTIAQNRFSLQVANGEVQVEVEPTPPGVCYKAHFTIVDGTSCPPTWLDQWHVPESSEPVTLADLQKDKKKVA